MPAPTAGDIITLPTPGMRIAPTTIRTTNSAGFTAETVLDSVTVPLVSGRTYRLRWVASCASTVAADLGRVRIREDSLTGTQLQLRNINLANAAQDFDTSLETEYPAVSTADKTFVATSQRIAGTGTLSSNASPTQPTYLYVDYIRG